VIDEIVLPDGSKRRLGNNPSKPRLGAIPVYGQVPNTPIIPRTEWIARIDAVGNDWSNPYLPPVYDQDGIGMCNASATVSAMEMQRAMQGLGYVNLSAGDLYHRICGGSDNGSTLEDGIAAAMQEGVAKTAVCPYLNWQRTASGAEDDRKNYRVLEAYLCPTFDHIMSAVLSGFSMVSGIWWYDSYTNLDKDGWLPPARGGRGGHAVHGYKAAYRGTGGNIEFGVRHKNSWTQQWGVKGLAVFPERVYQSHDIGGWWAVRSVVDEGNVLPVNQ
jgi:hypothetical protein